MWFFYIIFLKDNGGLGDGGFVGGIELLFLLLLNDRWEVIILMSNGDDLF